MIRVIGDQVNLNTSLKMGTILPILTDMQMTYGIVFSLEDQAEVLIPGGTVGPAFKYARTNQS